MIKSLILSSALCIMLLAGATASAATNVSPDQQYTEVSTQGEQTNVEGNWVNSGEVNTVQESAELKEVMPPTKEGKMTREEKSANAAKYDKFGGAITIIAMCIVIGALIILSLLFNLFGAISSSLHKSRKRKAHGVSIHDAEEHHDEIDSGEVIAAISMALAEHLGQGHDIEDTILTIRRMRKAYSPWNSKIYNLRVMPVQNKARR